MTFRGFFFTLGAAAFSAFLTWSLNQSTPDVRYSLSERIPISFANPDSKTADSKTPEIVQQLEVKNVGTLKADNVLVKIQGVIKDHMLNKHSAADEPKVTAQPRSFEVQYPVLPPGASFQLSFKSIGDGIGAKEVSVSDSRGQAREALSKSNSSLAIYVSWFIIAVYAVLIGLSLRSSIISFWKIEKRLKPVDAIVSSDRPFYMSEKGWAKAVIEVLEERLRNVYLVGREINKHPAHQFLQLDRPAALSDEVAWKTCTELAIDILKKAYLETLGSVFLNGQILDLLQIGRPKNFPETTWVEMEAKANKRYLEVRKEEYLTQAGTLKCLQEVKPGRINPDSWQTLTEHWQNSYIKARMDQFISEVEALKCLRETRPKEIPTLLWDKLSEYWEKQYFAYVVDGLRFAH